MLLSLTSTSAVAAPTSAVTAKPSVSVTLDEDGVLKVLGTGAGERMTVRRTPTHVIVKLDGSVLRMVPAERVDDIVVKGRGGNDVLVLGKGAQGTVFGGSGEDLLVNHGRRRSLLDGGPGSDVLKPGEGNAVARGRTGDDTYVLDLDHEDAVVSEFTAGGTDTLDLSSTNRPISFHQGSGTYVTPHVARLLLPTVENVVSGDGADTIVGINITKVVDGGDGDDRIYPAGGESTVRGGAGDDDIQITPVLDASFTITDTSGSDTLTMDYTGSGATVSLATTEIQNMTPTAQLRLPGPGSIESVLGGDGADTLTGNDLPNRLDGRSGADVLVGGAGADVILDSGYYDADTLTGGAGPDVFTIATYAPFNIEEPPMGNDTITDFAGGTDAVDLHGLMIKSGLGTSTVTVWNGTRDEGSITASNGHLWEAGDFS